MTESSEKVSPPPKRNRIEQLKTALLPAEFDLHSVDWRHPDEATRFYLKNFGIYNIKLRPETWMIRLRFDGGNIEPAQLQTVAGIAENEGLKVLLTARSQMELHGISAERVLLLWEALNRRGLIAWQTLTDNFRALLTDPLSDCAPDARIDTFAILEKIQNLFLAKAEWMGTLPRKFNTALIGRETPSFNPWGNDLLFALAQREGSWGFNLYLGGKNSETAQNADIFCRAEEASELFLAVAAVFREHGLRGSRAKTRLFHLIEAVGMKQVRDWIEEVCGRTLPKAGELRMRSSALNRDRLLPIQRLGHHGEIDTKTLLQAAQEAETKNLTLRLTPYQELWLFDPNEIQYSTPSVLNAQHSAFHLPSSILHLPSAPNGRVTACAGERYCPLSLWDIKRDSESLPLSLLTGRGITVGFSGCLKGCGRHHHSDVGLVGLRSNAFGPTERALRVFLGALQAPDPAPARLLFYAVPERAIARLFEVIAEDFAHSGHPRFEDFSRRVLHRYNEETLMLWYLLRQLDATTKESQKHFFAGEKMQLIEALKTLPAWPGEALETQEVISALSHRLWDRGDSL